jgi:hypothetical protein
MQSKLGRAVPEEAFWHNYFYQVHMLQVEVGFDPDAVPTNDKAAGALQTAQEAAKAKVENGSAPAKAAASLAAVSAEDATSSATDTQADIQKQESWEQVWMWCGCGSRCGCGVDVGAGVDVGFVQPCRSRARVCVGCVRARVCGCVCACVRVCVLCVGGCGGWVGGGLVLSCFSCIYSTHVPHA